MKHTFLLEERLWEATGEYTDSHAHRFSFQGQSKISHQRDHWTLSGSMKLLIDPPMEFFHTYRVVPLAKNEEWTQWESHNPAIGDLCGRFAFVGDTILSSWASKDFRFNGVEALLYVNDTTLHDSRNSLPRRREVVIVGGCFDAVFFGVPESL